MPRRYEGLRGTERIFAVAAVAALGAGAVAGCSSSEQTPRDKVQPTQPATTAEATSSATPTAKPSIEAPARNKTPQPERSRSTGKATEIPSPSHSSSPETTPPPNETENNQEKAPSVAELAKAIKEGSVDVLGGIVKDVDEAGNGYIGVRPVCQREGTGFGHGSGKVIGLYTYDISTGTLRSFDTKLPMSDKYGNPISTSACNELTFDKSKTFDSSLKKAEDGKDVYIEDSNGEEIPVGADITGDDSSNLIRVGGTAKVQGNVSPNTLLEPIPRETMQEIINRAQQQVS